ncbi:MAG: PilZ domain-containing protein [Candidatus Hydrogenedentota bacterium]
MGVVETSVGIESVLREGSSCFVRVGYARHRVVIRGVAKDSIWISWPDAELPSEGTGADLEFHAPSEFLCYHTRVVLPPTDTESGVVLQRSESADYLKYRRSWRVPTDLPAQLRAVEEDRIWPGRVVDLSADGALVNTDAEIGDNRLFVFSMQFPGRGPNAASGRIVHRVHDGGVVRLGVRFERLPRDTRHTLTWFLYKEIRRLYPEQLRELYPRPR